MQAACGLRLAPLALDIVGSLIAIEQVGANKFHSNRSIDLRIMRFVNDAHPPAPQHDFDLIAANAFGICCHVR